jgi:tetratricopeptide (TPR) repeat protein
MMKKTAIGLVFVLLSLVVPGCGKSREYKDAYEKALKEKSGNELFKALLDLDQRYPDTFELKSRLGELLLASGDLDKAETFLKKAASLSGDAPDDRARYDVALNLGVLLFEKEKYADSLAAAEKALGLAKDDPRGAVFLKARSFYLMGKQDEAIGLYEKNWDRRALMSRLDMNLYFDRSVKTASDTRALELLAASQEQFDYTAGQGVQASQLYEKLGLIDEAVLTAAMELEYLQSAGGADRNQVLARLADIGKKLDDKSFNPTNAGREILAGLSAYFREDWAAAERAFASLSINHYYFAYLSRAARLENEGATLELLGQYVESEKYFKSLPAYYYHFWRGMKKGKGEYNFNAAKEVLEKSALLAPAAPIARESRGEIARLLGLDPADGATLLLTPELEALGARLAKGEPVSVLEPAVGLLGLPDNVYTMQGLVFLRGLSRNLPGVKAFLDKKKAGASGRLKERLVMILGS